MASNITVYTSYTKGATNIQGSFPMFISSSQMACASATSIQQQIEKFNLNEINSYFNVVDYQYLSIFTPEYNKPTDDIQLLISYATTTGTLTSFIIPLLR
jgi:hypothetical protein